jgi:hypothetical protein
MDALARTALSASVVEEQLLVAQQVGDEDVEGDCRVLEVPLGEMRFEQAPQVPVRAKRRPVARDRS